MAGVDKNIYVPCSKPIKIVCIDMGMEKKLTVNGNQIKKDNPLDNIQTISAGNCIGTKVGNKVSYEKEQNRNGKIEMEK